MSAAIDYGRLDIDLYKDQTIDVSVAGGHTYSNKAIGTPLAAAPVYWFLRRFTPIRHDAPLSRRARYICRIVTTTLPYALTGVVMFRLLVNFGAVPMDAFLTLLAYAFGTIAWIHASMFSGHQMAANFGFLSFAAVWFASRRGSSPPVWFLAGLSAGLAALADYTAIFMAVVLVMYSIVKSSRRPQWIAFILGGAVMAVILMAYNRRCFGGPLSFSYANLGYGEFAEGSRRGILGVVLPNPSAFLNLLISPSRGIFFIMPVFLMSIPGFAALARCSTKSQPEFGRAELATISVIVIGYLLIDAGFYGWHGGWTFGPRYLVPMLPFAILPIAFALDRRWLAALLAVSFAQVALAQVVMPHTPEDIKNPVLECLIPLFHEDYFSENVMSRFADIHGVVSFVPWIFGVVALIAIAYRRIPRDGPASTPSASRAPLYIFPLVGIAIGLLSIRTADEHTVHYYRSQLLGHAAYVQRSPTLARNAVEEKLMSDAP